ncbi:MAG: hypothetical protein U0441_19965 [Polyangiaceae bacterium]
MQPAQEPQFPPTIDAIPAEGRLVETFAFTPGALGIGGLLAFIGSAIGLSQHGFRAMDQLIMPAACFFGGVLFGAWEIWRRIGRATLVFWGPAIGIYREGKLSQRCYRSQITIYQLNILNTIREVLGFGFMALIAGGYGLVSIGSDLSVGLVGIGIGIGGVGAFASSIYARIACRHFFIPKGNSTDQVMFTRGEADRFHI